MDLNATVTVLGRDVRLIEIVLCALIAALVSQLLKPGAREETDEARGSDVSTSLRREMALSSSQSLNSLVDDDRVLNPIHFKQFKVLDTVREAYNVTKLTLEIPQDRDLGLRIGRHVSVKADIAGQKVIRAYTPISKIDNKGSFDLLVKRYEDGKLSNYIWNLKKGDWLDVRGPVGRYQWKPNAHPVMGLIAAGSGITPCLQLIRSSLETPLGESDTTKFILFYQNREEKDILLRPMLEQLACDHADRLSVVFFLSKCDEGSDWGQEGGHFGKVKTTLIEHVNGYINKKWISDRLHYNVCPFVCICGPSGFNGTMKGLLCDQGHDADTSLFIW